MEDAHRAMTVILRQSRLLSMKLPSPYKLIFEKKHEL